MIIKLWNGKSFLAYGTIDFTKDEITFYPYKPEGNLEKLSIKIEDIYCMVVG